MFGLNLERNHATKYSKSISSASTGPVTIF